VQYLETGLESPQVLANVLLIAALAKAIDSKLGDRKVYNVLRKAITHTVDSQSLEVGQDNRLIQNIQMKPLCTGKHMYKLLGKLGSALGTHKIHLQRVDRMVELTINPRQFQKVGRESLLVIELC
jgi:hypothetical protein